MLGTCCKDTDGSTPIPLQASTAVTKVLLSMIYSRDRGSGAALHLTSLQLQQAVKVADHYRMLTILDELEQYACFDCHEVSNAYEICDISNFQRRRIIYPRLSQGIEVAKEWLPIAIDLQRKDLQTACEAALCRNIKATAAMLSAEGVAGHVMQVLVSKLLNCKELNRHSADCRQCSEQRDRCRLQCVLDNRWNQKRKTAVLTVEDL